MVDILLDEARVRALLGIDLTSSKVLPSEADRSSLKSSPIVPGQLHIYR